MTVVYSSKSSLRKPFQLLKVMTSEVWSSRELAWRIFYRDFSAQYKQTALGYLWAFIPPIMTAGLFLFLAKNSASKINLPDTSITPAFYILVGTVFWQLFVDCVSNPLKVIEGSKNLISKVSFPREAIVIASIGQSLFSLLIRILLLIAASFWFKYVPSSSFIVMMPIFIISISAFGTALGMLLLPPGLLYKDVGQAVSLFTTVLLFITPVGYYIPLNDSTPWYFRFNPLSYLINWPRDVFFNIHPNYFQISIAIGLTSVFVLFISWILFRISLPIVFERLGS